MITQPTMISSTLPITIDLSLALSGLGVLISLLGLLVTVLQGRRAHRFDKAQIHVRQDGTTTIRSRKLNIAVQSGSRGDPKGTPVTIGYRSREEAEASLLAEIDELLHRHTGFEVDTLTRLRAGRSG